MIKGKIKNDIIFIGALLLVIALFGAGLLLFRKEGTTVKVTIYGKFFGVYSLGENRMVEIKTETGYNLLVIEDGVAYVKEANCPDGICSSHRPIKYGGESILCKPNGIAISIESDEGGLDIVS